MVEILAKSEVGGLAVVDLDAEGRKLTLRALRLATPFTVVAAAPIRARIRARTPRPVNTNEIPRRMQ